MNNRELLLCVCKEIEGLLDQLVLVGGCATGLLITDVAAPEPRPTKDVDMVIDVINLAEYYKIEKQLRELKFTQSIDDQGVICRWVKNELMLDVMPTNEKILGFTNRWYASAVEHAQHIVIDGLGINYISAPIFIATKLEAFHTRGKSDYWSSHDLEDLISVIDGRNTIIDEMTSAPDKVINYISEHFSAMLDSEAFNEALPGLLPPDKAGQARLNLLLDKITHIARLT